MNIVKISQKKLNNPEKLLKGRASVSFSDINGLLIRIFRRKKFIRIIYIHRCTWNKKRIEIHLKVTTLSDARKICEKRTDAIRNGRHPDYSGIQQTQLTFNDAIEAYKTKKSSSWSARTLNEFNNIISLHVVPRIGAVSLELINVNYVKEKILDNLFNDKKYNTLKKVISYLKSIMQHICNLHNDQGFDDLHRLSKVYDFPRGHHFKTMLDRGTVDEIRDSIQEIFKKISVLKCRTIMPKIALEINFYLLLRVSELVNIRIQDLDFEKHLLHVPKTKTISEEDGGFYVPLSEHVEQLFKHALSKRTAPATNVYVFESKTDSGHASERTIIDLFYQSNLPMTIHGIRAMGRTWLGLKGVKFEFAEACLSHKVGNQTVQAYLRTDFIEERRVHMAEWSDFVQECIGSNSVMSAT